MIPYQNYMAQPVSQLIAVRGYEGARAYQASPNSTVPLFDSDEDVFYLKTVDGAGNQTIRTFEFSERVGEQPGEYATKADISDMNAKIDQLLGELR